MPEPGRRIVQEEIARGGSALPWTDLTAFARRAIVMARLDKAQASEGTGWVFFDRSLVDAAAALTHASGEQAPEILHGNRYHRRVFFAPPWPDIFESDPERRHGFDEAVAEHGRLRTAYHALGYEIVDLPKVTVSDRADFVLASLSGPRSRHKPISGRVPTFPMPSRQHTTREIALRTERIEEPSSVDWQKSTVLNSLQYRQ